MKRVLLTLLLTSTTYLLCAQYVDVSYPFHNEGSGTINSGLGYNQKIKSMWFVQYRAAYAQYELNDNSKDILNGSLGMGRTWMLNTVNSIRISPTIFLGYYNELNQKGSGVLYGIEINYQNAAIYNCSFPFVFNRYDGKGMVFNSFQIGIRYHPLL